LRIRSLLGWSRSENNSPRCPDRRNGSRSAKKGEQAEGPQGGSKISRQGREHVVWKGAMPRWMTAAIKGGAKRDDFLIAKKASAAKNP
jgi:hypothetical protein